MLSWTTYAVILVPGLGLYACGRRAMALLVACSFAGLNGFAQDWRVLVASWATVQIASLFVPLRAHE